MNLLATMGLLLFLIVVVSLAFGGLNYLEATYSRKERETYGNRDSDQPMNLGAFPYAALGVAMGRHSDSLAFRAKQVYHSLKRHASNLFKGGALCRSE